MDFNNTADSELLSFMMRKEARLLNALGMSNEARSLTRRARILEVESEAAAGSDMDAGISAVKH